MGRPKAVTSGRTINGDSIIVIARAQWHFNLIYCCSLLFLENCPKKCVALFVAVIWLAGTKIKDKSQAEGKGGTQ